MSPDKTQYAFGPAEGVAYMRDRFGFDNYTSYDVAMTCKHGVEIVHLHVKNSHSGNWEDLNLTGEQLIRLKELLFFISQNPSPMPESDNLNEFPLTNDEQARYNPSSVEVETNQSLAGRGYNAYGSTTDHKNYLGQPMPNWQELPAKQKHAWLTATTSIVAGYIEKLTTGMLNFAIRTNPKIKAGEISDGYHTFGELYDHRITLWIALCRSIEKQRQLVLRRFPDVTPPQQQVWRSLRHSDGELAYGGGWFVLGINTSPGRQVTYHLPLAKWDETNFADTLEQAPEWDNHTPADVLERLKTL